MYWISFELAISAVVWKSSPGRRDKKPVLKKQTILSSNTKLVLKKQTILSSNTKLVLKKTNNIKQ